MTDETPLISNLPSVVVTFCFIAWVKPVGAHAGSLLVRTTSKVFGSVATLVHVKVFVACKSHCEVPVGLVTFNAKIPLRKIAMRQARTLDEIMMVIRRDRSTTLRRMGELIDED